jgi:hypothetical protein
MCKGEWSFGVAAKLVNVYLKALTLGTDPLTCSDSLKSKVAAIHPPIDRLLLHELIRRKLGNTTVWRCVIEKGGWTCMCEGRYADVIKEIRSITKGRLWMIEECWNGYR